MTTKTVTVNLIPVNVTQFESIPEALSTLPEALILHWINTCWRNTQMTKLVDAMKERR